MKCVIFILDTIINILYPRELIEMSITLRDTCVLKYFCNMNNLCNIYTGIVLLDIEC